MKLVVKIVPSFIYSIIYISVSNLAHCEEINDVVDYNKYDIPTLIVLYMLTRPLHKDFMQKCHPKFES